MTLCSATTRRGQPCQAKARPGRPYCFTHDPDLAPLLAQARRRGGRLRAAQLASASPPAPRSLRSPEEVLALVEEAAALLLAGQMTERRSTALGFLAQVALRALDFRFEERLAALEAAAGLSPGGYHASSLSATATH